MDETIERLLPCEGEQFGVFSPTGPNTALIGSVLAETCRVIGTVDSVLMPKTPPIMDLCRSYPRQKHSLESSFVHALDFS